MALISKYSQILFISALFCTGCSNDQQKLEKRLMQQKSHHRLVNDKYLRQVPLGMIIDVPNRFEDSVQINIDKDDSVQIYGVGELIYDLAGIRPEYFFRSDDIELFFKNQSEGERKAVGGRSMVFAWADGKDLKKDEPGKKALMNINCQTAVMHGYKSMDSLSQKYIAVIAIPWRLLQVSAPHDGLKLQFDMAVGDADGYFAQQNKLGLHSKMDMLNHNNNDYGSITLWDNYTAGSTNDKINSIHISDQVSSFGENNFLSAIPHTELTNDILGTIKDKYDLSAKVQSCWSSDSLYLFIQVQDSQRKRIAKNTISKKKTFSDYGWIENSDHKTIWQMHASFTKYAGGALKNHQADTVLFLKKGKYMLKYISDESHAWNNWDDDQPETPFYGVVVYRKR